MVPAVDPLGAIIHRVGKLSPALAADMYWRRSLRTDFALRVIDSLIIANTTVVDIGAAGGLFTRRLAKRVGGGGRVHAFEPNPFHWEALERICKGRASSVTVHRVALSDRRGEASLVVPRIGGTAVHEMGTVVTRGHPEWQVASEVSVPVVRLDDLIVLDHCPVSFIKCDVEGHELAVLRGARATLASGPLLLIEVEQRHHDVPLKEVFAHLLDLGDVYAVFPDGLRPLSAFDVERDQTAHLLGKSTPTANEPPEYVKDFLVVSQGVVPEKLLDRRHGR